MSLPETARQRLKSGAIWPLSRSAHDGYGHTAFYDNCSSPVSRMLACEYRLRSMPSMPRCAIIDYATIWLVHLALIVRAIVPHPLISFNPALVRQRATPLKEKSFMKPVQTALGPVPVEQLGVTLMNEHLVIGFPGWVFDPFARFDRVRIASLL